MSNNWEDDEELTDLSDEEDQLDPSPPMPLVSFPTLPIEFPTNTQSRVKSTRPSTQRATQESRERGGLKTTLPPTLPQPRNVTLPLSCINDFIDQKLIDLNAEYQRGVVWNDAKQMGLIDSLFRNFHVPPIIFACTQREDGSQLRVCIDGKQRLTSIYRFIKGEIAYKDPTTGKKSYYCSPPGSRRKLIPISIKQTFGNKQIACVEYDNIDGELEREIFQRVQLGVTLGPADRLPAINGPYADLVRHLRREIDTNNGLAGYLDWGETRGKDFQALTQVIYLIAHGSDSRKAEPTTSRLEAFLNQPGEGSNLSALNTKAINTMQIFCRIVRHPDLGTPLGKGLAPIEFVMSAYLIFLHCEKFSDKQLSLSIASMRDHLLRAFPSRKFKTDAFKLLLTFITKQVPKLKYKMQSDRDDVPAILGPGSSKRKREVDHSADETAIVAPGPTKRKREVDHSADEADIVPVKKLKLASQKAKANTPVSAEEPTTPATSKLAAIQARAGKARTIIKKTPVKKASSAAALSSSSSMAKKALDYQMDIDFQTAKPSIKPKRLSQASSHENTVGVSASTQNATSSSPIAPPSVPGRLSRLPFSSTIISNCTAEASTLFDPGTPVSGNVIAKAAAPQRKEATSNTAQHVHSVPSSSQNNNRPPLLSGSTSLSNLKFHRKTFNSVDHSHDQPVSTSATTSPSLPDPEWVANFTALNNSCSNNLPVGTTTQMHNPNFNFVMAGERCPVPDQRRQIIRPLPLPPPPLPPSPPSVHSFFGRVFGRTSRQIPTGPRALADVTRDPRPRPGNPVQTQTQTQTGKPSFPPS